MSLCDSIDTLAMAYLDDELAVEERHELETHLTECTGCRAEVDGARADQSLIQSSLAAPRAGDSLRMRLALKLDAQDADDATAARAQRRRWTAYALPGSAILAAAAALAVFVGIGSHRAPASAGAIETAAMHQQRRSLPLEVTGASTSQWLHNNFAPVEPPTFATPGSKLLGARLLPGGINGHDAALLQYDITVDNQHALLKVVVIDDVKADDMATGDEVQAGERTVHVIESDGVKMVTYVDAARRGFVFSADGLTTQSLVALVGRTALVGPQ